MLSSDHVSMLLATGGYVGRFPYAPGTVGTLVGIPIAYLLSLCGWQLSVIILICLIVAAIWAADKAESRLKTKDPGCIVIDEIAGMVVTMLFVPFTLTIVIAGFFLFRVFDIIKPPPARQLERRLNGGLGIVMDDIAAGVMANIALRIGIYWFN